MGEESEPMLNDEQTAIAFTIRVVVEAVSDGECTSCANVGSSACVVDVYTNVDGSSTIEQLVPRTLQALNLQHLQNSARGLIEVNNWKPVPIESLTDRPAACTAGSLLKDIASHATLKIVTKPQDTSVQETVRDMRDRLLRTLLGKTPSILSAIKDDKLREFVAQLLNTEASIGQLSVELSAQFDKWLDELAADNSMLIESTVTNSPPASHPDNKSAAVPKFHQLLELPRLIKWFVERGAEPNKQQMQEYANNLNNSSLRRHSNDKVTVWQVASWFSSARQLQRLQGQQQLMSTQSATTSNGNDLSSSKSPRAGGFSLDSLLQAKEQQMRELQRQQNTSGELDDDDEAKLSIMSPSNEAPRSNSTDSTAKSVTNENTVPPPPLGLNFQGLPTMPLFENALFSPQLAAFFKQAAAMSALNAVQSQATQPAAPANDGPLNLSASFDNLVKQQQHHPTINTHQSNNRTPASPFHGSRSRLMFDPLTELPLLERWFEENQHPSWVQIDYFTESLNSQPYRKQYPPISTHNVKIWFKNRRAKCKRMNDGHASSRAIKHPKLEAMTH